MCGGGGGRGRGWGIADGDGVVKKKGYPLLCYSSNTDDDGDDHDIE